MVENNQHFHQPHCHTCNYTSHKPLHEVYEVSIVNYISKTDRKSTRLNSSHGYISYAVFCLKKKKNQNLIMPACHARVIFRVLLLVSDDISGGHRRDYARSLIVLLQIAALDVHFVSEHAQH